MTTDRHCWSPASDRAGAQGAVRSLRGGGRGGAAAQRAEEHRAGEETQPGEGSFIMPGYLKDKLIY